MNLIIIEINSGVLESTLPPPIYKILRMPKKTEFRFTSERLNFKAGDSRANVNHGGDLDHSNQKS